MKTIFDIVYLFSMVFMLGHVGYWVYDISKSAHRKYATYGELGLRVLWAFVPVFNALAVVYYVASFIAPMIERALSKRLFK